MKASDVLKAKFDERIKAAADSGDLDTVLLLQADKKAFGADSEPKTFAHENGQRGVPSEV